MNYLHYLFIIDFLKSYDCNLYLNFYDALYLTIVVDHNPGIMSWWPVRHKFVQVYFSLGVTVGYNFTTAIVSR